MERRETSHRIIKHFFDGVLIRCKKHNECAILCTHKLARV